MGFLGKLTAAVLGSSKSKTTESDETPALLYLPAGRLNLIRANKPSKECIYLEATLRIRKTAPFRYELVIDRSVDEEDETLEDDDLQKIFLLDDQLGFRAYDIPDEIGDDDQATTVAFSWIDLSSPEISERFEFVVDIHHPECSKSQIDRATDIIYLCIWEAINEKDNAEAPDEELLALRYSPEEVSMTLEQSSPHPQSDGIYPLQPSNLARPSSRLSGSDIEQSIQTTSGLAESIDENDSDEDQSDSSAADDIVNQLKGASLADKHAPSSPSIASPVPVSHPHRAPSPQKKPGSTPLKKVQIIPPESSPSTAPHASQSPSAYLASPTSTVKSHAEYPSEGLEEEDSFANDGGSQPDVSPPADPLEQDEQPGTEKFQWQVPLTDAANEPTPAQARVSWESICNLYLFDCDEIGFKLYRSRILVQLLVSRPDATNHNICWLRVIDESLDDGTRLISTSIEEQNDLICNNGSIFFNDTNEHQSYTWVLRFPEGEDCEKQFKIAQEAFTKALYERDNGLESYGNQDLASKGWDRLRYGVIDEATPAEEEYQRMDEPEDEEESEEEALASSDDEDNEQERRFRAKHAGPKNSLLTIGYKEDLSCVSRANMVGIFKNEPTSNQKLKFMATIPDLCTPDGKRDLMPSKIMLHGQDTTMVIKDSGNPNSLYNLDLTTGKVVEEWKISKEGSVRDFFPRTKFSQMNPEGTFLGTSANSFYTIDPRVSGYKAVGGESKSYKTPSDFSCASTTESGQIALGSNTGVIRLYDSHIGKNAKTLLPAMKDPILAIDVTKDGKFLIATCERYLVFIDCQLPGSGILGFDKSFPKAQKPGGRRVELTPEHRAQIHSEKIPFRFKPAKFDIKLDTAEKTIVTAIGPYIIAFDLKKLKMGITEYTVRRHEENIVADSFRWGNDKDIVVAMPSSVFMEKRKKLSKPMRESLIFVPGAQSRSTRASSSGIRTGKLTAGIVQEWDA